MKKLFSSIMMAAAALFITSCASDDMTSSQTGEKAEVTFALGLEDGIGTRAISDGTGANYLAYAVFNADGTILEDYKKQGEAVTFPVQKTLTLAKDKTYKIVFWAQNSACTAYTVSDDMKVTVDYAGINNDETRDAFFKTVEFTVKGAAQIDVELQRALAQINVGVTAADWEAAKKSGVTIEKSVAYIKQAATSVDLLTGKASDPVNVTYTENAIPAEDLVVDGETYKWLSMSYILVADGTETGTEKATLNDLGFSFNYTGGAVEFKSGLTSVPVQRNYRTNIVGKLLTGDVNFNITVDNIFADDHAYPDAIEQQLELAAAVGGAVTLTEDVTLDKTLEVQPGVDMIINLNGHSIKNTSTSTEIGEGDGIIVRGNLIIDGEGEISAKTRVIWARGENAHVTIKGGKYVGADANTEVIYASGANSVIDIYGGEFEALQQSTAFAAPQYAVLNLYGNGNNGCDINVFGGKFKNFDPSNNVSENPKKDFVEEGYSSVADGDYFMVVEGENAVAVSSDADMKAALTADVENITVYLTSDVTYEVAAWANDAMGGASTKSIVIEGNGKTITFNQTNSDWNNIVTNGATLTINNAKITNSGYNDGPWNRHDLNFACNVVLNNVTSDKAMAFKAGATLTNVTINDANTSDTYAIWIQPKGQTVTLDGCTIDMLACTDGRGIKIDNQYVSAADEAKVTLNVSNTVFKTEEKSAILVKSTKGADITLSNIDITEVAADSTNPVWVDNASAAYADKVNVTGGTVIVEP